jgi:hypothetical protein
MSDEIEHGIAAPAQGKVLEWEGEIDEGYIVAHGGGHNWTIIGFLFFTDGVTTRLTVTPHLGHGTVSEMKSLAQKLANVLDGVAPVQGLTREKLDALIKQIPVETDWERGRDFLNGMLRLRDAILATTGEPEPVHDESWDGEKSRQPSISLRDLLLFRLEHPTSPGNE